MNNNGGDLFDDQSDYLDWDSVIKDENQNIILPEGDYRFKVDEFKRDYSSGSGKIKHSCKMAIVSLSISFEGGIAHDREYFLLHRSMEWKIIAFFKSIGMMHQGEEKALDWNHIVGSEGRAHFKPETYTDDSGISHTANNVERFIDAEDHPETYTDDSDISHTANNVERFIDAEDNLPY